MFQNLKSSLDTCNSTSHPSTPSVPECVVVQKQRAQLTGDDVSYSTKSASKAVTSSVNNQYVNPTDDTQSKAKDATTTMSPEMTPPSTAKAAIKEDPFKALWESVKSSEYNSDISLFLLQNFNN